MSNIKETESDKLIRENLKKKLVFEGKFLDCLIKILDDLKETGHRANNNTIQVMINYIETLNNE